MIDLTHLKIDHVYYVESPTQEWVTQMEDHAATQGLRFLIYRPPEGPAHCKFLVGKAPKNKVKPAPPGRPTGERSKIILNLPVGGEHYLPIGNLQSLRVYVSQLNKRIAGRRFSSSQVTDQDGVFWLKVTRVS